MNFFDNIALRWEAFKRDRIAPGFQKSLSWLAAVAALGIAYLPDAISAGVQWVTMNWSTVMFVMPTFTLAHKLVIITLGNVLVLILRPIIQRNMPRSSVPVAQVVVPSTVQVGGATLATEVVKRES